MNNTVIATSLLLGSLAFSSSAVAQHLCGSAPEFHAKVEAYEKTAGDLKGKAQALAKLVGTAELSGQITAERKSIYRASDSGEAARHDAYLQYVFCIIIMEDTKLGTTEKLKALQEFRRPLSELSISESAVAFLSESVSNAVRRAQDAAAEARKQAKSYSADAVSYSLKRAHEIETAVYRQFFGAPNLKFSDDTLYWGEVRNDRPIGIGRYCCGSKDVMYYVGEFTDGTFTGTGKLIYRSGKEFVGTVTQGAPKGFGCLRDIANQTVLCGYFDGLKASGIAMHQLADSSGIVEERIIAARDRDGALQGAGVAFFLTEGSYAGFGTRYEGDFNDGLRDGYGVAYFSDGTRYEGQWTKRAMQGFGRKIGMDGKVLLSGFWQDGKIQGIVEGRILAKGN